MNRFEDEQTNISGNINLSNQGLQNFPVMCNVGTIIRLDLSNNSLETIPDMSSFVLLRQLDLSNNALKDLSPLIGVSSLRTLNCSYNHLTSLTFLTGLPNIEIFYAQNNGITEIKFAIPKTLIDCNISNNSISSLDFLQLKTNVAGPDSLELFDISGNPISGIMELRYISVCSQLHVLKTGLLELNKDIDLLSYVKYLCPSLDYFDDNECTNIAEFEESRANDLVHILLSESEARLKQFLSSPDGGVWWSSEPSFQTISDTELTTPLKEIGTEIQNLQDQIATLGKMHPISSKNMQRIKTLNNDILKLQTQLSDAFKIIFVHDNALKLLSVNTSY